jgi:PAS domain S-box-containing protein
MVEMKIGHSGKYPYVKINLSPNEEGEISTKLPMSKMWYKDLIYEIEKVAEEEKKKSEKYLHEDNRKMMIQSFDIYSKLMEISNELRRDMEIENGAVEHKRVDESLLKREERLRLSLASSGISFWEWFPENGRINFDNRWVRVLGFEPGERAFDFQWWEESIHPDCKPVFEKALNDYLEGRYSVFELEYQIKTKTGDWKWIWAAGECVEWDKNKKPVRFLGTHKDITERKQTEEALRESEKRYRSLFEESPISLWEEDFSDVQIYLEDLRDSGVKDLRGHFINHPEAVARCVDMVKLIDVNKATLEMYDAESIAEFRNNIGSVFGEDSYDVFREALSVLAEGETIFEGEATTQTLKGDKNNIVLKLSVAPGYEETWSKVLISISNITDRKQAEEALKISIENLLEESNQRKILSKRLIDLMEKDRHDIAMELQNNIGQILTSLKINLELIDDKLKPIDNELGSLTKDAIKRANQVINDLNNIAHGLMPSILYALGLESSLRSLFSEFREHTDIKIDFFNRNIGKRFDKEKELAIYRIVQEALNNIVKHAEAKNVSVNLLKKGNVLSLSVEDNGVGFDQDKAMKISKDKGSLGLVIMRERAMQLDGELTIESLLGKGTHILAEIPI